MSNDPPPPVTPQPPAQPPPPVSTAPVPPATPDQSKAHTWNMLCHLAALGGFVFPFGNVLGPLLVWQIKKNEFPSVAIHGRAAVNFQLTVLIALIASIAVAFVGMLFCIGFILVFVPTAVFFGGMIFAIIAGIKANDGVEYKYPYSFNLVG